MWIKSLAFKTTAIDDEDDDEDDDESLSWNEILHNSYEKITKKDVNVPKNIFKCYEINSPHIPYEKITKKDVFVPKNILKCYEISNDTDHRRKVNDLFS